MAAAALVPPRQSPGRCACPAFVRRSPAVAGNGRAGARSYRRRTQPVQRPATILTTGIAASWPGTRAGRTAGRAGAHGSGNGARDSQSAGRDAAQGRERPRCTGERQQSALHAIVEQIGRLDSLVSGLLALTQPFSVKPESVDVHAWLEARLAAMRDRAEAAQIRLQGSCSVERWTFDPAQTARALDNLLLNALQHTPREGAIDVGIEARDHDLVIRVSDGGTGIATAVRDHLFEPFATGRPDGTGLGLALVREIAIAQGGTVRAVDAAHG